MIHFILMTHLGFVFRYFLGIKITKQKQKRVLSRFIWANKQKRNRMKDLSIWRYKLGMVYKLKQSRQTNRRRKTELRFCCIMQFSMRKTYYNLLSWHVSIASFLCFFCVVFCVKAVSYFTFRLLFFQIFFFFLFFARENSIILAVFFRPLAFGLLINNMI